MLKCLKWRKEHPVLKSTFVAFATGSTCSTSLYMQQYWLSKCYVTSFQVHSGRLGWDIKEVRCTSGRGSNDRMVDNIHSRYCVILRDFQSRLSGLAQWQSIARCYEGTNIARSHCPWNKLLHRNKTATDETINSWMSTKVQPTTYFEVPPRCKTNALLSKTCQLHILRFNT